MQTHAECRTFLYVVHVTRANARQGPKMNRQEIERHTWRAICTTINKFREHPDYFFTESDIVTYLCKTLYSRDLEVKRGDRRIYLVHREYPTNFRYSKRTLLNESHPYPLEEKKGHRGHFDLVVLNREWVADDKTPIKYIVNKAVCDVVARHGGTHSELAFALETKYVINNSAAFAQEVLEDSKKLRFAVEQNNEGMHVVNLVFCNTHVNQTQMERLKNAVQKADGGVTTVFIQAFYDATGKKCAPIPNIKFGTAAAGRGLLPVSKSNGTSNGHVV